MLGVAAAVVIALAATFVVVYRSTGSQLLAEIDRSVHGSALQQARRYARAQPYRTSNALLFVIVPGVGTASNHPELFGARGEDDDETAAEQALENVEGRNMERPDVGYSTRLAPDTGRLRLFEVRFRVGGRAAYAGAGEPMAGVVHAQEVVRHSFELAGAVGLALALLAASLIGTRIAAPIRRSAGVAARVDAGDLTPRIELPAGTSGELQVLADALNHMLDRLGAAFAAQRDFVADASHELRTPLTVMRGQLDLLSEESAAGTLSAAELSRVSALMESEIGRLTRLVDDLLVLAQSDREDFLHPSEVRLDELAIELWDGLSLIAERNFELGELEAVSVRADPDRLAQALRNLARNSIAHTRAPDGLVRIDVARRGHDVVRITVSDDGPGIAPELRDRVFERFYRTDRARTRSEGGAGLGLAIVRAIAEAHGGSVRVAESAAGGAAVALDLPAERQRQGAGREPAGRDPQRHR